MQTTMDYEAGVWYDRNADQFCRIVEQDDTFGLYEPHGSEESPYFTFDEAGLTKDEAIEEINRSFMRLHSDTHENPVEHASRLRQRAVETKLTIDEELELRYCFEHEVTITKQE